MKINEAKDYLPIVQAMADGKTVQVYNGGRWWDVTVLSDVSFKHPANEYRIKPEPKLRPWKPEEVPVGALIAWTKLYNERSLIIGVCHEGVQHVGYSDVNVHPFKDCLQSAEHSTDGGKTWHPCGVLE